MACQGGRNARRAHGVQLASPQNPQLQEPAGGEAAHGADRAAGPAAARAHPGGPWRGRPRSLSASRAAPLPHPHLDPVRVHALRPRRLLSRVPGALIWN